VSSSLEPPGLPTAPDERLQNERVGNAASREIRLKKEIKISNEEI